MGFEMKLVIAVVATIGMLSVGAAEMTRFSRVFGDGTVLQRDRQVPIWGVAMPKTSVRVCFGSETHETVADSNGHWEVCLGPLPADACGRELVLQERDQSGWQVSAMIKDVLVGEVWLVAGQSNMACPLEGNRPRFRDGLGGTLSQLMNRPMIRYVRVPTGACEEPASEPKTRLSWRPLISARGSKLNFSAIGVTFALAVQERLGIPIGVIETSEGGTGIDTWMPANGCLSEADTRAIAERRRPFHEPRQLPGRLWNFAVNPLTPMACRGLVWYQGESNCVAGQEEITRYKGKLRRLLKEWREAFRNPEMPVYVVQICSWGSDVAAFQEEQAEYCTEDPLANLVIVNDLGNLRDIHPNRKAPVGLRAALLCLSQTYGYADIRAEYPHPVGIRTEGNELIVSVRGGESLYYYNPDKSTFAGFEIAEETGPFVRAEIVNAVNDVSSLSLGAIDGMEIRLVASNVAKPVRVRYLHASPWYGSIHNDADLPMGAFQMRGSKR